MASLLKPASLPVLLAACLSAGLVAAPDTPKTKLNLGVLRRDGILLPFASYDDGKWSVPWPGPLAGIRIPLTIEDVPNKWWGPPGRGTTWRAWKAGQNGAVSLDLKSLAHYGAFCSTRLGLLTDYRGEPFDRREPTAPKDALAIAGDAPLLPIDTVKPDSADGRAIAFAITPEFNIEEDVAAKSFSRWTHPIDKTVRRRFPIQVEAIYRSSETTKRGTWTITYVEAVRKFPPGTQDEGCGLITYANAWIREGPDKPRQIDLTARVTYCDREGAAFMLPFGRLSLKNEIYWAFQMSSWRDELYFVTRMRPDGEEPVVAVSGGECPRPR